VDGDFALQENELQPALKAPRKAGINIVTIHNHMTHEQLPVLPPRLWGRGRADDLATMLKPALAQTQQTER
jgi:Domain of Unknown Function (DUF1259)